MNITAAVRYPALTAPVAHPRCEIPPAHQPDLLRRAAASARRLSGRSTEALALLRGVVVQVVADVLAARNRWRHREDHLRARSRAGHPASRAAARQVLWEGLLPRGGWTGAGACHPGAAAAPTGVLAVVATARRGVSVVRDGHSDATAWAPPVTWPPQPRRPLPGSCAGAARRAGHRARGSTAGAGRAWSRACATRVGRSRTDSRARCLPRGPGRVPR